MIGNPDKDYNVDHDDPKKIQIETLTEALQRAKEVVRLMEKALADLGAPRGAYLFLVSYPPDSKINVIKALRELKMIGLKEAKAIADTVENGREVLLGNFPNVTTNFPENSVVRRSIRALVDAGATIEWRDE